MTTLVEDLQTAQLWAKGRFKHDVEIVDAVSVYINFEFRTAVTITPEFTEDGKRWFADVTEWDASGGVNMEIPLSDTTFTEMTSRVSAWLDTWEQTQLEIEAYEASMSDYIMHEQDMYSREYEEESLGRPLFPNEY